MSSADAVLSVTDLSVNFGGLKALSKVNLELRRGEVVGLIGPNGAGKTTVFNALCGIVKPAEGSLSLYGEKVRWPKPHQLVNHRISRTLQGVGLFPDLTVAENVMVGAQRFAHSNFFTSAIGRSGRDEMKLRERAQSALERVYVGTVSERRADTLSYPDTKRVAIARALVSEPEILLLDEPAGGLGAQDIEWLNGLIRNIKAKTSIIIVEHHMDVVMSVCDRIYVLNFGQLIASGTPNEVRNNDAVIEAYLGTHSKAKS
ncbi:MAG: ABC transporter ATP-binding protein [Actinomycetales bacterium]|nr:ABC transporter ATP-binding protein [Actinomycetales bacterium]